MYVEYSSNNSGGDWWLDDEDWKKLEAAGWKVWWNRLEPKYDKKGNYIRDEDGLPTFVPKDDGDERWLGSLAREAFRKGLSLRDAVEEWERVTGKSSTDAGCPCCGPPHHFAEYTDDGKFVDSGPRTEYTASW